MRRFPELIEPIFREVIVAHAWAHGSVCMRMKFVERANVFPDVAPIVDDERPDNDDAWYEKYDEYDVVEHAEPWQQEREGLGSVRDRFGRAADVPAEQIAAPCLCGTNLGTNQRTSDSSSRDNSHGGLHQEKGMLLESTSRDWRHWQHSILVGASCP